MRRAEKGKGEKDFLNLLPKKFPSHAAAKKCFYRITPKASASGGLRPRPPHFTHPQLEILNTPLILTIRLPTS